MNHRCQCHAPILYYDELSPQARSCYMLIKMLDIDVELQHINLVNGEHLTDAYNRINPSSTVPTLIDGKFVLYDGHTIMIYLCDKYFCAYQAQLCPQRYLPRLLLLNILFYEGCVLYRRYSHLVADILTDKYSNFDIKYHQNKITDCYSTLNSFLMGHCFMVGNCITIADLSIVSTVSALDLIFPINQNFWPNLYTWFMCLKNMPWYIYNAEGVAKQRQLLARVGQFPFPTPQRIREIMPRQNSFDPKSATKNKNKYKKKRLELQSSRSDSRTESRTMAHDAELKISKSRISVLLKDNEKDESTDDDLNIEEELQQGVYFKKLPDEFSEEIEAYIDEEQSTQQKNKVQQKKKAYIKKESSSTSKDFQSKYSKSLGQKSTISLRQDVVDEVNKDVIIIKSPKSKQSISQESADEFEEEAVPTLTYPSKHSVLQEPVKYKELNMELEDNERDVLPSTTVSNILHPRDEVAEVEEEFSVEEEDESEEKEDTELDISKKYDYSSTQLSNKQFIPDQQQSYSKLPVTKANISMEKKIKKPDEKEAKENLNLFDATTTEDSNNESLSSPCKRMNCACLGDVKESVREIKDLLTKHSEERRCVDLSDDSSNGGSLTIKLSDANFNNTSIKCFQFKCILSPNGCTLDRYAEVVKQLKQELCQKFDGNADRNDTSNKDSGASSQPLETNLNNEDSLYKGQRMTSGADSHIKNELQNEGLLCNCEECTGNMKKVAFCPCVVNKNSFFKMGHIKNDDNNGCRCINSINREVRADVKLYICDDDNGNLENYTENYLKYMKCALNQTFTTLNSSCLIEEMPKINPDIQQELIVLEEDDRLSSNSESETQLKSIEKETAETKLLSLRDEKESFKQDYAKTHSISKVPVYKNDSRLTADSYMKLKNVSQRKSLKNLNKAQSSSQKLKKTEKIQSRNQLERKNYTQSSKSVQEALTSNKNCTSSKSSLDSKYLKNECHGKFPSQQEYENAQFTVNTRASTVAIDKSENYFSIIKLINDKDKRLGALSVPSKIPKLIKRPESCSNESFQKNGLPLLSHTCSKGKLGRDLKKCATYKNISTVSGSKVPDVREIGEIRFSGGSSNCADWDVPSTSKCQTKNSFNTTSDKEKKAVINRTKKVDLKSVYRCSHSLGNKVNGEVESQRRSAAGENKCDAHSTLPKTKAKDVPFYNIIDLEVLNCPEECANINDYLCKNHCTKSYTRETTIKKVTKQKTIPSSKKKMDNVKLPTPSKKVEKSSKRQLKPVKATKDPGVSTKNICRKPAVTITPPSIRLKTTYSQIFRNSPIEREQKINHNGTMKSNILAYYKYHSKSFLNNIEFQLNENLSQYLRITPLQPINSNHPEDSQTLSDSKYIPQGRLRAGSCNRKFHQSFQNIETKIKSNCFRPLNCYACNCVKCQKGLLRPLFQYTIISDMFPLNLKDPMYKLQSMQRPDKCL